MSDVRQKTTEARSEKGMQQTVEQREADWLGEWRRVLSLDNARRKT
jgi:hypothetical protein